ncbi:MAG: helicase HerA-like domain-containing protein [Isosphaeraceae bacterium]|nr:helicase HerA-like domain-containing protein [Isosphaeraceae bacterium]
MIDPILVAKNSQEQRLLPNMANRHGLIAGATGTGKTVTLQRLAEGFSRIGVPVFLADVKGDLSGLGFAADPPKPVVLARVAELGLEGFAPKGCPVTYWDVFGKQGHPIRATVSEMGPVLLARLLGLNEIQTGVLSIAFRVADDNGLLLLDLPDLRAILMYVSENAKTIGATYGNVSPASVGAIQRGLLRLEQQGGTKFFGEPALDLDDFMRVDAAGMGYVNILAADELLLAPQLYATFLLWMLAELFERLPEVGDPEKPKLVFFFDEAHLLFKDTPRPLMEKIEQVVRLVRSKGVGVYFVTQNPLDLPDTVLGQLGNRVQHALRAFTPRDRKAVRAAAETFRENPEIDTARAITELQVGEALVSFLDSKGSPGVVERSLVVPPACRIGPISAEERSKAIRDSEIQGKYETMIDRESAYEILTRDAERAKADDAEERTAEKRRAEFERRRSEQEAEAESRAKAKSKGGRSSRTDSVFIAFCKSAARSIASGLGRAISRGILGVFTGGSRRR